jgi:thiol-disulfide isomerase/thioredoxin
MFGKKSNNNASNPTQGAPGSGQYTPGSGTVADRTTPPQGVNGILAGQVLDGFNRKPPPTIIQVVSTDAKEAGAAPITVKLDRVTVDPNGYFTIQNLQPGRTYQLIAKAEDGGKKLAGVTWAIPPNPRVTIRISEDFAGKDIPEGRLPPRNRTGTGQRAPKPEEKKDPAAYIGTPIVPGARGHENSGGGIVPGTNSGTSSTGADIGTPIPGGRAPPVQVPLPNLENTVKAPDDVARLNVPDTVNIRGPGSQGRAAEPTPPAITTGSALVPSCSLSGRTLHNFALNDLDGKPWVFNKDRKGRLVLLDFWHTDCVPCQYAVPHLKDLQWRYGQWGLEVVGIAYESGTPAEQTQRVKRVAARLQTNYRLLMGSGMDSDCPVRKQFQVRKYPSLFLLDEKGQIVWQSREGLGPRELQELEFEIQRRLNVR